MALFPASGSDSGGVKFKAFDVNFARADNMSTVVNSLVSGTGYCLLKTDMGLTSSDRLLGVALGGICNGGQLVVAEVGGIHDDSNPNKDSFFFKPSGNLGTIGSISGIAFYR